MTTLKSENRELSYIKQQYQELKSVSEENDDKLFRINSEVRMLKMNIDSADVDGKERQIEVLKEELNRSKRDATNALSDLENRLYEKEQTISKMNYEINSLRG